VSKKCQIENWKNLLDERHGETQQERREEFQLPTQEGQEFSAAAAAAHLITYKSSESQNVDLTNNDMVNHYLRDVEHG